MVVDRLTGGFIATNAITDNQAAIKIEVGTNSIEVFFGSGAMDLSIDTGNSATKKVVPTITEIVLSGIVRSKSIQKLVNKSIPNWVFSCSILRREF